MPKQEILVVEDDKNISKLLKYNLEKAGYDCVSLSDGETALETLKRSSSDLVILDIMLPGVDGFEVCRRLKQDDKLKNIPVIMLTAKGEEMDRVVGLELGADDYVIKPFSPRELLLRVKAILKRANPEFTRKDILQYGSLKVDLSKHKATLNNREISLTPMEFNLLTILMERSGRVQSREQLLSDVWDMHSEVYTRTVDTHIKRLREKLGRAGKFIETVRGLGYRFQEEDED